VFPPRAAYRDTAIKERAQKMFISLRNRAKRLLRIFIIALLLISAALATDPVDIQTANHNLRETPGQRSSKTS